VTLAPAEATRDWKRYPYVPDWGDAAEFTLPAADGYRRELGIATYFVDGFVRGATSGRLYAFMVILTDMHVVWKLLRASFLTFALYDCDRAHYGTTTDYDFPRPFRRRAHPKLDATPGHLALHYRGDTASGRWENLRDAGGALRPFATGLELRGVDHHGAPMALTLDIDATRPPAPLGGRARGGEMMFLGIPRTFSYFQSGLQMRGELAWGDAREKVSGDVGWIDRQWAHEDFSRHQDRASTRYQHEWRVIQLDDGWDMSCFHQYLRPERNAVVPWSGLSAQGPGPDFELRATTQVEVTVPEFIRSPGLVRGQTMMTEGPRWFPHRYRLRAPEWDLDLAGEPLVEAPAHALPIEYWTGPVRIAGTCFGRPVSGLGFDERARPWVRGFEMAAALRLTVEHLPGIPDDARRDLAYRAWEVEALALRGDRRAATAHVSRHIEPLVGALPPAARARVAPLASDLLVALSGRFRIRG
jgi:hypothetical protein